MKKPKVGQVLYSLNIGNAARNTEQVLTPVEVVKVGRKYFYCCEERLKEFDERVWGKYYIDGWNEENGGYSANSCLYESKQAYDDEKEEDVICSYISECFEWMHNKKKVPLDGLRQIKRIIDGEQ